MSKNNNNGLNLFEEIVADDNIYKGYKETQKGKSKFKHDAMVFSRDETYNLLELKQSLVDELYEFDGYTEFKVLEPKERIINAPFYKDKIVQVAINNILKEVYNSCFIFDSYSCIEDKGTHKCAKRIQSFVKKAKWEYGESAYIVKVDIKKFFYSIDRDILKEILPKKIKCKKTLRLLYKIIDSADIIDFLGLPLGNTLSQICANIYMNELDQYMKRKLGLKYYVRYADDMVIIVRDKDLAKQTVDLIEEKLNIALSLHTNKNKTKIFPINQGVNAIGYKIYTTHMLLRNDSKKRIKRKIKAMPRLISEGRMTIEKAEQMLNSWKGHADNACSYNFIQKLILKHDFLYISESGSLKVNKEKIKKGRC